jgi:hypothetical protein
MAVLFQAAYQSAGDDRLVAEIMFNVLPAGPYVLHVVLQLAVTEGELVELRNHTIPFVVQDSASEVTSQEEGMAAAQQEAQERTRRQKQQDAATHWGIVIEFPPSDMHHFESDPHVTWRVEGDFSEEHTTDVYLNGVLVSTAGTPKATLVMDTVPFEEGIVYNLTLRVVEPVTQTQGRMHVLAPRVASVLFTSVLWRPNEMQVCLVDSSTCVSFRDLDPGAHDLDLEPVLGAPGYTEGPMNPWIRRGREGLWGRGEGGELQGAGGGGGRDGNRYDQGKGERAGKEGGGVGEGGVGSRQGSEYVGWERLLALETLPKQRLGQLTKHASSNAHVCPCVCLCRSVSVSV